MPNITIDQETLCNFCCDYHDSESFKNRCEGSQCEKIREIYFDNFGIEINSEKTFKDINLSDILYYIKEDKNIPEITKIKILKITKSTENEIIISSKDNTFYVNPNKNKTKNLFIKKSDALEAFETICTKRIIEISKAIGKGI